jgi:DNA-binding NarL/FixJ family response regulator
MPKELHSVVRVLVVEDSTPFRQAIKSLLQERPYLQIVGEAVNGLEAVQKFADLHPDIVLMDIGLPQVNGIEAARHIREQAPQSRIIFLTQEGSAEVVREAFRLGARAYVSKMKAANELLEAIDEVMSGRRFVTGRLRRYDLEAATGT